MQEQVIQVHVKTELKDYYAFTNIIRGKWQIPINIVFSLSAIIGVIIGSYSSAIYLIAIIVINYIWNKFQDKKIYDSNKLGQKERVLSLSENGIEATSIDGNSASYIKWDELYGARQNEDAFFLLTSKAAALIIPKRFLKTEEISNLETLIKSKMGEEALKGPKYIKITIFIALGLLVSILCVAIFQYIFNH
jgi:Trk-type K+ transport system membrane component